ncbi:MAG: D-alanyl-D-alanine carboxypeptidase family protein [Verrucomicrobiota bacterium]|nr:D-alanyl-D-alanine carboxypeptidase family protein [Verrucomicrobiota bacterium]
MKKSNVTVIAAVLIALHLLVFTIVIGSKGDRRERKPEPAPARPPAESTHPNPEPPSKFEVPELRIAEPEVQIVPVEVVEMPKVQPRQTIAMPGRIDGYLRSDRPNRRASKVYPNLVGNPYQSAIVVDARTGKILFEDRAAVYAYPASVTKLMTMLITLEQIDAGNIGLNDKVAITKEGLGVGGSQIYLDSRESGAFTVNDLLNAVVIHSACDAARVLGIHVAGSKDAFIDMMNQKARELGMNSTVYHSEHGLPPSGGAQPDISTAYDVAILTLACLRHPETLRYTSTKLAYLPLSPIRKEKFMLANRNALVGKDPYSGCDGLKTGYHKIGGWSLAATAERNGRRVVSVVLGAPDKTTRNATTRKLLDKGFQSLEN